MFGLFLNTPRMSESKPCGSIGIRRLHHSLEPMLYCSFARTVIFCFVQKALQWLIVSTDERGLYLTGTSTILWVFPAIPGKCQSSNLKLTELLPPLSFPVCNANVTIPFYAK